MSRFLLETDSMSSVAESVYDKSQELLDLSDTVAAYAVENDTFDFASAKNKISENLNKMSVKTSNIAQVISFTADIHTAVQNCIKCQASEGLTITSGVGTTNVKPTSGTSQPQSSLEPTPQTTSAATTPNETPQPTEPSSPSETSSPTPTPTEAPGVVPTETHAPSQPQEKPTFVNYYQQDYTELPTNTEVTAGGASTAMAMVLSAINEKEITPIETTEWITNNQTPFINDQGEIVYFDNISEAYGIDCETIDLTKENILKNISEGKYMIISMDEGKFGNKGNYVVITGITEDGKIKIADPNSMENSETAWDISTFLEEGLKLWGFSKNVEKNS